MNQQFFITNQEVNSPANYDSGCVNVQAHYQNVRSPRDGNMGKVN